MDLPPPPPAVETKAFEARDVQLRTGVGTTPRVRGKGGTAIWTTGLWSNEFDLSVGVLQLGGATFSVGVGAAFGRPYVVEGLSAKYIESRVKWSDLELAAWHWGARAIGTMHLTPNPDGRFNPYVQLSIGPQQLGLSTVYDGVIIDGNALYTLTHWQAEQGLGVDLVLGHRTVLSLEAAYSLGLRAQKESSANLTVKDWELLETSSGRRMAPPRGWTASVALGRRFG